MSCSQWCRFTGSKTVVNKSLLTQIWFEILQRPVPSPNRKIYCAFLYHPSPRMGDLKQKGPLRFRRGPTRLGRYCINFPLRTFPRGALSWVPRIPHVLWGASIKKGMRKALKVSKFFVWKATVFCWTSTEERAFLLESDPLDLLPDQPFKLGTEMLSKYCEISRCHWQIESDLPQKTFICSLKCVENGRKHCLDQPFKLRVEKMQIWMWFR